MFVQCIKLSLIDFSSKVEQYVVKLCVYVEGQRTIECNEAKRINTLCISAYSFLYFKMVKNHVMWAGY